MLIVFKVHFTHLAMDRFKIIPFSKIIAGAFSTVVLVGAGWQPHLQAQSYPQGSTSNGEVFYSQSPATPSRERGQGLRGSVCGVESQKTLAPLMSANDQGIYEVELDTNPTLSWEIPETDAKVAEFLMVDKAWNEVYQTEVEIPEGGGEVQLSVPETLSLETQQDYYWQFALVCDGDDRTKDDAIQGVLQFTPSSSTTPAE